MRLLIKSALTVICCFLLGTASAQTEIHKCTDANGNILYSQLPCSPVEPAESDEELSIAEAPREESQPDTSSSECKKRYRDAIDAIDAEIGREYSAEKAEQYKQRLLQLTRKLRQC